MQPQRRTWLSWKDLNEEEREERVAELQEADLEEVREQLLKCRRFRPDAYYWLEKLDGYKRKTPSDFSPYMTARDVQVAITLGRICGHERHTQQFSYFELSRKSGVRYGALKRSIRKLKRLKLYEFSYSRRCSTATNFEELKLAQNAPWTTQQTKVRQLSSWVYHRGKVVAWVEEKTWQEATSKMGTRGGRRPGAGRPKKNQNLEIKPSTPYSNEANAEISNLAESLSVDGGLENSNRPVNNNRDIPITDLVPVGLCERPPRTSAPSVSELCEENSQSQTPSHPEPANQPKPTLEQVINGFYNRQGTPNQPTATPTSQFPSGPPLDPPGKTILAARELDPNQLDSSRASMLAEAYRKAVKDVYGTPCMVLVQGDIRKSKVYPALLSGANALMEHGIAPYSWAHWRLEHAKSEGRLPLPISVCFSQSTIHKQRGFFRRSYDAPAPFKYNISRTHLEQLFRHREAGRRNRGIDDWHGLPDWYAEIRKEERAAGFDSPWALYPKLKDGKWYRRGQVPWAAE